MIEQGTIDLLWRLRPELLFVTKEQFTAALDGWEATTHDVDGEPIMVTLVKGPELHFRSLAEASRAIPRSLVRKILQDIIDRHGYVIVKTPKDDLRQQRFNRAIGFYQVGEDEYDVHLRMDLFGAERRKPCQ